MQANQRDQISRPRISCSCLVGRLLGRTLKMMYHISDLFVDDAQEQQRSRDLLCNSFEDASNVESILALSKCVVALVLR